MQFITRNSLVRVFFTMVLAAVLSVGFAASVPDSALASSASAKHAAKAYKTYLAKHTSVKYFRVVKMGNGGVPVLLCSECKMNTGYGRGFTEVKVLVYKKADRAKVKNIGTVSTHGSTYPLFYAKNRLFSARLADMHMIATVQVKNGKLSMDGIYDNQYADWLAYRTFSGYNPMTGVPLSESSALGEVGTKYQYDKLWKTYGKKKLTMYKNTKANRKRHIV